MDITTLAPDSWYHATTCKDHKSAWRTCLKVWKQKAGLIASSAGNVFILGLVKWLLHSYFSADQAALRCVKHYIRNQVNNCSLFFKLTQQMSLYVYNKSGPGTLPLCKRTYRPPWLTLISYFDLLHFKLKVMSPRSLVLSMLYEQMMFLRSSFLIVFN